MKKIGCDCNGNSLICDPTNGICSDCTRNTMGDHCEQCIDQYFPDPQNPGICTNSKSEKDQNNQAIGMGVGISFGLLALLLVVLFIFFFLKKKVFFFFFLFLFFLNVIFLIKSIEKGCPETKE